MKTINLTLFASGSGTNVENIANYFAKNPQINISCVLCNKPDAYVIERAKKLKLDFLVFNKADFQKNGKVECYLLEKNVNFIILAGFLWLIPEWLIEKYPNKIVNIHPALLPKYGGKGMYGDNVHKAVLENKEKETGISIHYVNKNYDEGDIIFQAKTTIDETDNIESIAQKVHELEYKFYPQVIENILLTLLPNIFVL
ncbi:MAG: phosphoribosylglycinamide formyltransferase [Bacteroidales bacterium]|jgi:phosphoribosylglycinamide formyltransferase-1|nr:phosphoribosylglycinamide formyltransferase [Bacteroidales bacterium]OQC46425.1 MAG: Phosphoribosylglycinamide formyltransferase [Bacteroidetes bacterium ADurb.Bin028]